MAVFLRSSFIRPSLDIAAWQIYAMLIPMSGSTIPYYLTHCSQHRIHGPCRFKTTVPVLSIICFFETGINDAGRNFGQHHFIPMVDSIIWQEKAAYSTFSLTDTKKSDLNVRD